MNKLMKFIPNPFSRRSELNKPLSAINIVIEQPTSLPQYHEQTQISHIPNLLFIWLDATIDEMNNVDCRQTILELKRVVPDLHTFVDIDQCQRFLLDNQKEKIFLIASGSLGQDFVPKIHHLRQIVAIYIFCSDKSKHEHWVKIWSKIKGVLTAILPICHELKQIIRQHDRDSIRFSVVSIKTSTQSTPSNQLDPSFMYTQILKEILFNIDFRKKSIKDLTKYCQKLFSNNENELKIISEFENKYEKSKSIWWYTRECFLHRMLNQALRTMDIDIITKMGFFVRDLHHQIEEVHQTQFQNNVQPFMVYRGQGLSMKDFEKILKTKGGLLSFNNFLSTTENRDLAIGYARRSISESELMGIVFKLSIDPSISSTPYAQIKEFSYFKGEGEILFSMHTIFRIENISPIEERNDQLWEIELILTNDIDQQLNELTQMMREETQGLKQWFCIGQLFIKLGQFIKAEEWYKVLLDQKVDHFEEANIYHQLGWINANLGYYPESIEYYKKSLDIIEKNPYRCLSDLATCYDNIGLVCELIGDYSKALLFHEKALMIYQKILPSDHPDIATTLINIGSVYRSLKKYKEAQKTYENALKIYLDKFPKNHPSLAILYNNIGLVYNKTNDFARAFWYYDKVLEIYQTILPVNHPDFAIVYQNYGKAFEQMGESSKAIFYYEKALVILQTNFQSDHPQLARCYTCTASVYGSIKEYSKALSFYEMALEIREQTRPIPHRDLVNLYNDMGDIYDQMNEHTHALSFYQKAFQICQTTSMPDNFLLATSYHKMAKIHYTMGAYREALPYIEQAVYIGQLALAFDDTDLQMYINTLKLVKAKLYI